MNQIVVRNPDTTDVTQTEQNVSVEAYANSSMYQGASTLTLTQEEMQKLTAPFPEEKLQIKGNGLVYLPTTFLRQRLNEVIGIGQWALIPRGNPMINGNRVIYHGALYVRGCFVSEAIGGQDYVESNYNQTWDDAVEGAKTDCLSRCCKDLGMNAECWDKDFCDRWISKYADKRWDDNKKRYVYFKKGTEYQSAPKQYAKPQAEVKPQPKSETAQAIESILEDLGDGVRFKDEPETAEVVTEGGNVLDEPITFGKHKGQTYGEVPIGYLQALTKPNFWKALSDSSKEKVIQALKLRQNG